MSSITAPTKGLHDSFLRVLSNGQVFRTEIQIEREETLSLEHSLLPIMGADGAIMGAVAVFHDITELKKLDRLKTDFISTVSHELRTPMTSIKGFIKLILVEELGPITPQQRECLSVADQEADHLTHLINDLLDISRIEAGRLQFTWARLAPGELIAQVLQTLRPQAGERRLYLEADIPSGLPAVRGDRQRVIQILTNLIENALKFTPPGGRVGVGAGAEEGMLRRLGDGHRRGHPAPRAGPRVRPLLSGRGRGGALAQRHGPRPRHRQATGRTARGPHLGGEPPRARHHLHLHPAPGRAGRFRERRVSYRARRQLAGQMWRAGWVVLAPGSSDAENIIPKYGLILI